MSSVVKFTRSEVLEMAGYVPGRQPAPGSNVIKLNTNESPFPPSPKVAIAIKKFLLDDLVLRRYPNPQSLKLRQVAAAINGCKSQQVIVGNGSDELLRVSLDTFVEKDEQVAFFSPSYSLYPVLTRIRGGQIKSLPLFRDGVIYQPDLSGVKLFFLTTPNAPLGFSFSNDYIRELARGFNGILVVDEAYADFAEDNALALVNEFDNLVVLRTLSKSYGLASLRVGLGFAAPTLIEQLDKVRDSYNLDGLAQAGAQAALEDQDYLRKSVALVIDERQHLSIALQALGFKVEPSQTNFIFVTPPRGCSAAGLQVGLEKNGILVRYFPDPQLAHGLRISIGTKAEMGQLINVIEILLKNGDRQ
ncbi:histidinol-phosphate transaminase [bacterium]|nr:histidinol-phosphate transaminase [bacterium]